MKRQMPKKPAKKIMGQGPKDGMPLPMADKKTAGMMKSKKGPRHP